MYAIVIELEPNMVVGVQSKRVDGGRAQVALNIEHVSLDILVVSIGGLRGVGRKVVAEADGAAGSGGDLAHILAGCIELVGGAINGELVERSPNISRWTNLKSSYKIRDPQPSWT